MDANEGDEFSLRTDDGFHLSEQISHIQDDVIGHDREVMLGPDDGPHLLVYVDVVGSSIGELNSYRVVALGPTRNGYKERGEVSELHDLRKV